jgi:hypothetical protein
MYNLDGKRSPRVAVKAFRSKRGWGRSVASPGAVVNKRKGYGRQMEDNGSHLIMKRPHLASEHVLRWSNHIQAIISDAEVEVLK